MEAKHINIADWGYFGEGSTATSYCNKKNGNLFLKLNKAGYPESLTREEFLASKLFSDMGLPVPSIYDYVTDGERFGYTAERIKGKISFARILSQEPDRFEEIASRLSAMAKELHRTKADTSRMKSCLEYFKGYLGDMSYLPADVAAIIRGCLSEFSDIPYCLHGDLNPGNVINYEGRDYWIGINSAMFGDPCWDIATMYVIANCIPAYRVKELYHFSPEECRKFYETFKKHYFGDSLHSPEAEKRIHNAVMVKCCALIKSNPSDAYLYVPFIRGKKLLFRLRMALRNLTHHK